MDKVEKLADIKAKVVEDINVDMQHKLNKKTAKERILCMLDEGSFIEVGGMNGKNGGGVLGGYGTVEGRLVFVCGHDYTINGGSLNRRNALKICRIMDMALEMGAPFVRIFDSIGGNITEGLEILESYGKILKKNADLAGVVPRIGAIAGPTNGMDAVDAGMNDFVFMVENSGKLSLNSNEAVIKKEGTYVEDITSSKTSMENGSVQILSETEDEMFDEIRKLISLLPANNKSLAPMSEEMSDVNNGSAAFDAMVNDDSISVKEVVSGILDSNSMINVNEKFDDNCMTVLGRMNGLTTGVIAVDNKKMIDIQTCEKIARFIKVCDNFNIGLVTVVNNKGFVCSAEEEKAGLVSMASKLISAYASSQVGKVALIIGDAVGAGFLSFASKELSCDMAYAWPSARISVEDPVKAIKRDFADEITGSDKPKETEGKIIEEKMEEYTSPYNAAYEGIIDEVIQPSETRARICGIIDMLQSKKVLRHSRKHGSHLI